LRTTSPLYPEQPTWPQPGRHTRNPNGHGDPFLWRRDFGGNHPPGGQDLLDVHQAYMTMAASGVVTEVQRSVFDVTSHRLLKDKGAQAILLGGTDLVLVYDERTSDFPLIDCASIHADSIARLAIG